jgi:hypothetical protein
MVYRLTREQYYRPCIMSLRAPPLGGGTAMMVRKVNERSEESSLSIQLFDPFGKKGTYVELQAWPYRCPSKSKAGSCGRCRSPMWKVYLHRSAVRTCPGRLSLQDESSVVCSLSMPHTASCRNEGHRHGFIMVNVLSQCGEGTCTGMLLGHVQVASAS